MITPTFKEEKRLMKKGYRVIAGIDEVGRGPIAGPVVASAVMIKSCNNLAIKQFNNFGIRDSKLLSPKRREEIYKILINHPKIVWRTGRVSEKVIDRINILEATKLAMKRAVKKLKLKPDFLLLDGNFTLENLDCSQKAIPGGDKKVFLIAASSIIAKVTRDRLMVRFHKKYPQYRFERHKGYGTKLHFKMIKKHGPCKIHRYSFRPIKLQD